MFTACTRVMIFSEDPEKSARWWGQVLNVPVHLDIKGASVFAWLDVAGLELGFHMLDQTNNPRGGSVVPYFAVADIDTAMSDLIAAGCTRHRGPYKPDDGTGHRIAQIVDPFGNIIGLDGP
jgi:predicted enzyme related to lactoylglutathione lyase